MTLNLIELILERWKANVFLGNPNFCWLIIMLSANVFLGNLNFCWLIIMLSDLGYSSRCLLPTLVDPNHLMQCLHH